MEWLLPVCVEKREVHLYGNQILLLELSFCCDRPFKFLVSLLRCRGVEVLHEAIQGNAVLPVYPVGPQILLHEIYSGLVAARFFCELQNDQLYFTHSNTCFLPSLSVVETINVEEAIFRSQSHVRKVI